jgi:hypothetical protein
LTVALAVGSAPAVDVRLGTTAVAAVHLGGEKVWPVGAGWTPADLPGIVGWVDATDPTQLNLNGTQVLNWNGSTALVPGNVLQLTPANANPTYTAGAVNGKPAIRFDNTPLLGTLATGLDGNNSHYFVVASLSTDPTTSERRALSIDSPGDDNIAVRNGGFWGIGNAAGTFVTTIPAVQDRITAVALSRRAGQITFRVGDAPPQIGTNDTTQRGLKVTVGGLGASLVPWIGYICEVVLCSGQPITDADIDNFMAYARTKWGAQ